MPMEQSKRTTARILDLRNMEWIRTILGTGEVTVHVRIGDWRCGGTEDCDGD